jgi:GNAT superfamily N-acetyltransferase
MVHAPLHVHFVAPAPHPHADESALDPDRSEFRMLRTKGRPDIRLALRPARLGDGDALQSYVRGLSPLSRYNRFLGAASELPESELARALAANGRDTLTLLLTSTAEDREAVVGEARVALSCAERAGEFAMSIADDWRRLGVGSALLEEIERKAGGRRHRMSFRRHAADQRGDDRTGARPRLPSWSGARTAPRANSEAVGGRSS